MAKKFKMKKGDKVVILTGKDKGKTGEILRVDRKSNRAVVDRQNMIRRHTKPSQTNPGGIVEREASIHISNLALADPKDDAPTRVGYKFLADGRKVRFAKRSGEVIDV